MKIKIWFYLYLKILLSFYNKLHKICNTFKIKNKFLINFLLLKFVEKLF